MKTQWITLSLVSAIILSGCGIKSRKPENLHYFLLSVQRPDNETPVSGQGCFQIRPARMAAAYAGRSLVYRTGTVSYEQDYYNRLLTTPDSQITEIMKTWFEQAGMGQCVANNYLVQTEVQNFCADFSQPDSPAAVVKMHITVTRPGTVDTSRSLLLDKSYRVESPLPAGPSAAQVVIGLSQSLEQILRQLETDLTPQAAR